MKMIIERQHWQKLEKAVRYMISNLQYERHQALMHGCSAGSYDKEIEEYRELKKLFV